MITFQTFNFNNYSQDSYDLDIHLLLLLKSNVHAVLLVFHRHAVYPRYLTLDSDNTILISIVRIKCESCNCTHALLPSIIIPYRILSNPCIIKIIQSYRNVSDSASVISKITGFSRELVKKIIAFYIKFHKERLTSFLAFFGRCDFECFDFIINYFSEYHVMFMQHISTKNMIIFT